jgi:hypothetical protein
MDIESEIKKVEERLKELREELKCQKNPLGEWKIKPEAVLELNDLTRSIRGKLKTVQGYEKRKLAPEFFAVRNGDLQDLGFYLGGGFYKDEIRWCIVEEKNGSQVLVPEDVRDICLRDKIIQASK